MSLYEHDLNAAWRNIPPLRNIADELRAALDGSRQFSIRYQPIIEGKSRKVVLVEALLRWTSPVLGEVLPGRFIHIAEKNGLIRQITRLVLEQVCQDIATRSDLVVSVNISRMDITDSDFPDEIAQILAKHGVSPKQIVLECTDSIPDEDARLARPVVNRLRGEGHAVAIYELESGFTSFGFLKMHGFTLLKVDRALIDEALQNATSRKNLQEAIEDSRSRGLKSLAFGVETRAQANLVDEMGFDMQQGFYHSLSLSIDELIAFADQSQNGPKLSSV